ncbi:site-2 protease family protein [Sphingomonas sp. RT2P30]|uniref:site-2 protease family protein n=1 Tax=Parasphingomonas halimpatiens TaxID=3096162 RepID=UPI002FC7E6CE
MTFGLRLIAQALLLLTSLAMYAALGALRMPGGVLASIIVAALLTFVAILGHELAHAVVAHLVGARIRAIVALPFRLRLHPLRLDLSGRGGRGDLGGYVSYTLDRVDARRKHAIIAAAGPLANLVLALLAGMMAAGLDHRATTPAERDTATVAAIHAGRLPSDEEVRQWLATRPVRDSGPFVWSTLLAAFAILSGGLGLANLIPYGGSDGDRILDLWRWHKRLR